MIGFLRKNFPATVTSDTVKKLGLASKNESYVINVLQFLGLSATLAGMTSPQILSIDAWITCLWHRFSLGVWRNGKSHSPRTE
jgi:hypothetical protein